MSKICYKVLSMSEAYIFKQKKIFGPIYSNKMGIGNVIEENIEECKNIIYNNYRNQSVTVFLFDKNKIK